MPRVTAYRTQVDVQAWTPGGQYYHDALMGDLTQIQIVKDISQPYGTFVLSFTARQTATGSWADKLPFRTYVEIRAGVGAGTPPIVMRGFVDQASQLMQMPRSTGGPSRSSVVTGRDYGALLTDWQILYLWGIDPMATYLSANSGLGNPLSATLGIQVDATDPAVIIADFFDTLVTPALDTLRRTTGMPLPPFRQAVSLPPAYQVNMVPLQNWQGAWWNFLDYFASPPWGEAFVFDDAASPVFLLRQTPYKTWTTGAYPLPFPAATPHNGFFGDVTLNAGDVTAHQLTTNQGLQLYTYYLTVPDLASMTTQTQAAWYMVDVAGQPLTTEAGARQPGSNPYFDVERAAIWGVRPLQVYTPWIAALNQLVPSASDPNPAATLAARMNTWLVQVFRDNDKFVSGTLQTHFDPAWQIGRYVTLPSPPVGGEPGPWEAYIERVSHTFDLASNQATATSTLNVVRGRLRTPQG